MKNYLAGCLSLVAVTLGSNAVAQNATTTPVGVVTLSIPAAPNSATPRYTLLNIPLAGDSLVAGQISAFTGNTITLNASVSATFNSSNPHYARILSGSHAGRTFLIQSNSNSTLTIDSQGSPLDQLAPPIEVNLDRVEILPADTLLSVFGVDVQGGASASVSDQVWIWSPVSGSYNKYYYHSSNQRWQDTVFGSNANNVVIRPDTGIMFVRRATSDLLIDVTGTVRTVNPKIRIMNSGYTLISGGFPVSSTLLSLNLHQNANWVSASSASASDQVWIWSSASGSYNKYYYNSVTSRWQDTVFGANANSTALSGGSAVMIKRLATTGTTFTTYTLPLPYSL